MKRWPLSLMLMLPLYAGRVCPAEDAEAWLAKLRTGSAAERVEALKKFAQQLAAAVPALNKARAIDRYYAAVNTALAKPTLSCRSNTRTEIRCSPGLSSTDFDGR